MRGGLYAQLVTMQMGPAPAAPSPARPVSAPPNVRSLDALRTRRTQAKARPVELASVVGAGYAAPPRYGFGDEEVTVHAPRHARPPRRS